MSYLLIGDMGVQPVGGVMQALPNLWWQLACIISCGTLAAVLIPEFTKIFTSSHSKHVHEIVTASREGGASLTILSGIVAGNFSAFWMGSLIAALMALAFFFSTLGLGAVMGVHASIFAFGLVAFGFLCMGPVTIAVDSYGPVTDNAQSVFELAQTEKIPGIREEIWPCRRRCCGRAGCFNDCRRRLEADISKLAAIDYTGSMTTITLPPDLEVRVFDEARRQGTTTEQLALDSLRRLFTPATRNSATVDDKTLFDSLCGYIGAVSGSGTALSENCGQHFTDGLVEKQQQRRL